MIENIDKKPMEILNEHENPCLIMDREMTDVELAKFIQMIENDAMLTAPRRLKENILDESMQLATKIVKKSNTISIKMQLLLYSLKISAAVAGAIFLLGVIQIDSSLIAQAVNKPIKEQKETTQSVTETLSEKSNAVSSALNNFSSNLINWR